MENYLSVKQAASRKGVSQAAIYKAIEEQRLQATRILGRLALRSGDVNAYEVGSYAGVKRATKPRRTKRQEQIAMNPTHESIVDEQIMLDERGLAYLDGTRIKVLNIAEETQLGRSPQAIQEAHPHLTLAQIHAALSYYYSHQAEIDAEIERRRQYAEESRAKAKSHTTLAELKAKRDNMDRTA